MRALVTGGTGFVGANLVAALKARGIIARVLRRESASLAALTGLEYETAIGDVLAGPEALVQAMADCDWVFHLAAVTDYWRKKPDWIYRVNVEGTKNVLAAAQSAGIRRFVFTSSVAALGVPANGKLLDESSSFNLTARQFPYGHSKHLAETEVRRAVEAGLAAVIVNPTGIIGPRDVNQISGSIILEATKGHVWLTLPGGLNMVAVEDVVAGHIAAAERGRVGERYLLAGENLSYQTIAATVCKVVGRPPPAIILPRRALPAATLAVKIARVILGNRVPLDANQVRMSGASVYADGHKAIRELGMPQTPFKSAVQRAYEWYQENGIL